MNEEMNAQESITGFCAWLTSRPEVITMSSKHDAAVVAEAIRDFSESNKLAEVREGHQKKLVFPK